MIHCFSFKIFQKMSAPTFLKKIKSNADAADSIITSLKNELVSMKNEAIVRTVRQLEIENEILRNEIENTKRKLIQLETNRGIKQISVPNNKVSCSIEIVEPVKEKNTQAKTLENTLEPKPDPKQKKEKPVKKDADKQSKKEKTEKTIEEASIDVGRLDMRIGLIKEVAKHPDADSLYVSKIDCGEPNFRTVVSGLVKFVKKEELEGRLVVLLCNLKPAKMRGVTSEAMVMCASTPEKVEVLTPPAGSVPGDLVHCEGYPRNPDPLLNPKKKIFETCAPDLKTNTSLEACFKDAPIFVPNKGKIVSQTLAGVQVK